MTPKGAARAVADLSEGVILASVEIEAPPERVFAALASPELAQWWGSDDTYRVTRWTGDVRPGGTWKSEGVSKDGKPFSVSGEFLEVERPHLLVHTWKYDWDPRGSTTRIRYRIDTLPNGSRVTVRHEGFQGNPADCDAHALGWERVLGWLTTHLQTR
jgi:uncharacterized protein YndB with AHSA1/START domain